MMTSRNKSRYSLLRLAAVLPVTAALVVAFSFTAKATEYRYNQDTKTKSATVSIDNGKVTVVQSADSTAVDKSKSRSSDEIVVVGYGTQSAIDKQKTIVIRGVSDSASQPLYIVDGQEIKDLSSVNAADIASITVLKDKSAKDLYGERAANGVILVTMKTAEQMAALKEQRQEASKQGDCQLTVQVVSPDNSDGTSSLKPEEGALVQVVGTTKGTVTDKSGSAIISTLKGNMVKVSAIGYESQTLTASEGNKSYTVMLRSSPEDGATSTKPIYIVDGKRVDINTIDAKDIAKMTVLKGTSATDKYGDDGTNGVIEITLKSSGSDATPALTTTKAKANSNDVLLTADVLPTYNGGDLSKFRDWVMSNVKYPAAAQKANITGKVLTSFVINKQGNLTNIKIISSPDKSLSDEVVRVLRLSSKWTPGKQDGKAVNVSFTLPIDFKIPK